ncbi:hypothetical protein ES708_24505 [subsurface metagenome]
MRVMGEADAQFDQADYIEFYAVGNPSKYSATSIYWLTYSEGQGARMEERASASGAAVITPTCFASTVRLEENDYYRRIRTGDETADRWLWRNPPSGINGDSRVDYDYEIYLPDLSPLASPVSVTLRAAYYSFCDAPPHPNHHTKVYINANLVDDAEWDGMIEYISVVSVTQPAMLLDGNNTITIEVLLDTGAESDLVMPNYFEVDYWRDFKAIFSCGMTGGKTKGGSTGGGENSRVGLKTNLNLIR